MRIEIWADMVCAWAYIGKRRLEKALADWDGEGVEVVWRPFRMDPTAPVPATPREELLRDPMADEALRACAPDLTPSENRMRISKVAAAEGLGPTWGAVWRSNSHDAHRLLALGYEQGGADLQNALAEEVLRAYFINGLDIGLPEVLGQVAVAAGFPRAFDLLAKGGADRQVKELVLTGKARHIRTSPTLVVGGQALAGAQPPEVLLEFLRAAAQQTPRALPAEVERLRHAESLLDQRDPLGALVLLRPLLDEHGNDANVMFLAARAYYRSAQLNRAAAVLEKLTAKTPDDSYARHLLGRTLQRQGRDGEAAVHLSIAGAMTPEYA